MTGPLPLKTRLLLFLYGTKNLVGCLLALTGLGLFFAGFIEDWWLLIVAGLYAAGWLIAPENRKIEFALRKESDRDALTDCLEDLVRQTKKRLPAEARTLIDSIRQTVQAITVRMNDGTLSPEQKAIIINSVTRDLPNTVSNYLRLPAAYANVHVVDNGRTCRALLIEQLSILDTQLKKIADGIYRDDADALILNGRILGEKFHTVNFVN